MADAPHIKPDTFTLGCREAPALAKFYAELLPWEITFSDEDWACVGVPGTNQGAYPGVLFQRSPSYIPPVWPEKPGAQQQMAYLDSSVNDLEKAVRNAVPYGAVIAQEQFSSDWTVMRGRQGAPFVFVR